MAPKQLSGSMKNAFELVCVIWFISSFLPYLSTDFLNRFALPILTYRYAHKTKRKKHKTKSISFHAKYPLSALTITNAKMPKIQKTPKPQTDIFQMRQKSKASGVLASCFSNNDSAFSGGIKPVIKTALLHRNQISRKQEQEVLIRSFLPYSSAVLNGLHCLSCRS